MAHKIALRVADLMITAKPFVRERRMCYLEKDFRDNDTPLRGCAAGLLYVGMFLHRGGCIANVVSSFDRNFYRYIDQNMSYNRFNVIATIATYVRVPEELILRMDQLHLDEGQTRDEIIGLLRSGELDGYCE